jgi:hypothetical protein
MSRMDWFILLTLFLNPFYLLLFFYIAGFWMG